MILPTLMYLKTQKSLTLRLSLAASRIQQYIRVQKKKGKHRKHVVFDARKIEYTHNISLTFYSTITATSYRTELALTYQPDL